MSLDRVDAFLEQADTHFGDGTKTGKLFVPSFAVNAVENSNLGVAHDSLEEAWPDVDPGLLPLGNLVLVQVRQPKLAAGGGAVQLTADNRKTELDNTQVAKVIAVGPIAFRNRNTGEPWPEGAWCQVGDFVRIPKYQGDYQQVPYSRTLSWYDEVARKRRTERVMDRVLFAQFKDIALLGRYPTPEAAMAAKAFY